LGQESSENLTVSRQARRPPMVKNLTVGVSGRPPGQPWPNRDKICLSQSTDVHTNTS